ncbi:MAG: hypothetical protein MZV63_47780 [Marinilabiliales bacterium]|nr:hypothetical protein [Marinilabiliales bacterium]
MNDLIYRSGSYLSHLSAIGHQTYLTDQQVVNRFNRRHYDMMRIGEVRAAVHETEPLFRDATAAVFDIGSVRQSDAPGTCPSVRKRLLRRGDMPACKICRTVRQPEDTVCHGGQSRCLTTGFRPPTLQHR